MINNYFKVAFRNFLRHRFFSVINIFGLTVGLTSFLFIVLYIVDELSYDRFHKDSQNIYRIAMHARVAGQEMKGNPSCTPLAEALQTEVPGVEQATRLSNSNEMVFRRDEKVFTETKIFYADSNFFDFFSFHLLQGDAKSVLKEPNSVVLTEALAKKYFAGEDPIGKNITLGRRNMVFKVTGVSENPPSNSHIEFNALLSTRTDPQRFYNVIWLNNNIYTYFRKNPNTSLESINSKLVELVHKYAVPQIVQYIGTSYEDFVKQGGIYTYYAYPMLDTQLYTTDLMYDLKPKGNIQYVYILGSIALFILLIACINFMNLSTAKSGNRAKEVGLRKTLGSMQRQMVFQFLSESFFYVILAALASLILVFALMPWFNLLSGKELTLSPLGQPALVLGFVAIILFTALFSGSYPAFYLTQFKPVEVLKGQLKSGLKSKAIRSSLVVFQFTLSILLIIATVVVYNQLHYMQTRDMGMDRFGVLCIQTRGKVKNPEAFKNSLLSISGVKSASYTNNDFPGTNNNTVFRSAGDPKDYLMNTYFTDYDHLDVMKITLKEGRFFSREFPSDSLAVVVNEAAVREMGWDNPLQHEIINFVDQGVQQKLPVIGVIKDFNFEDLRSKVRPTVIVFSKQSDILMVRFEGNASQVLAQAEAEWKKVAAGEPYDTQFLDANYDRLFRQEQRVGNLLLTFTVLAIFIASLGLFALSVFSAEQRTKEIGIRKAMGASIFQLSFLLTKEFLVLVLVAYILAVFPAWYFMRDWLTHFNYRIDLEMGVFIVSGILAIVIAWATVGYQSIKAALSNPAQSLRID